MKAFKYDFDGKKFFKVTYDIIDENDFSNEPETMFSDDKTTHNCDEFKVDAHIRKMNDNIVDKMTEDSNRHALLIRKCKDCGKYYIINYDEYLWFTNRQLSIPSRCGKCRRSRKAKEKKS